MNNLNRNQAQNNLNLPYTDTIDKTLNIERTRNVHNTHPLQNYLKILSYNIHGLESKVLFPKFFEYLKEFDLIILIETHVEDSKFENYRKYFTNHRLQWISARRENRFGRAISGMLMGIRKGIEDYGFSVNFKETDGVEYIEVQANRTCLNIVPIYLRGKDWENDFDKINNILLLKEWNNQLIIGDMNARIGDSQQIIEEVYRTSFTAGSDKRVSKDNIINTNGRKFLELCNENGLIILNGQTKGDEVGNLTFIGAMGCSVNDFCAIGKDILACVDSFLVDTQIWSDHMPLVLCLKFPDGGRRITSRLLPKLVWKDGFTQKYQRDLNLNLANQKLENGNISLEDITKIIINSVPEGEKRQKTFCKQKEWFDHKCLVARQKSFKLLRTFKASRLLLDKQNYLDAVRNYKSICKQSKTRYFNEIETKIDMVKDSKSWWKLAKQIRGEKSI